MREKIILAPGLNGNELMTSLALRGVNCIGVRICGAAALARLALMRSGMMTDGDFISIKEEAALVAEALNGEPYFGKASCSDIQEIAAAIRRMRSLIADEDEERALKEKLPGGIFAEKNAALWHVYQRYMALLHARNAVDVTALIRRAASVSRAQDADFLILEEYPLNPLEKMLLNRVSGGMFRETGLLELFAKSQVHTTSAGILPVTNTDTSPAVPVDTSPAASAGALPAATLGSAPTATPGSAPT